MSNNNIIKMMETLNSDYKTKQYMQKKFMKLKIQEAKDKKCIIPKTGFFDWASLPIEIEEKILKYKRQAELIYIPQFIKENKIFNKVLQQWLFKSLRPIPNMHYPLIKNHNIVQIMMNIINKRELFSLNKHKSDIKLYNKLYKEFTKNKSLSIFDLAQYALNEVQLKKDKKKLEDKELDIAKIGDVVFFNNSVTTNTYFVRMSFYNIVGETATMWKVKQASQRIEDMGLSPGGFHNDKHYYNGELDNYIFNISKKQVSKYNITKEYINVIDLYR